MEVLKTIAYRSSANVGRIFNFLIQILRIFRRIKHHPPQLLHILFPNYLDRISRKYGTDKSSFDHDYTHYYFKYFHGVRFKIKSVLEIGVREGWSHKMWLDFFPNAVIYGIDIGTPPSELASNDRTKIFIGDQADTKFLSDNFSGMEFDIIIDDGGHRMAQQQISLKALYKFLRKGGYYMIEDLHTSRDRYYWDIDDYRATTLYALKSYKKRGQIDSHYFNEDDKKYFAENTKKLKIFRNAICFIEKR